MFCFFDFGASDSLNMCEFDLCFVTPTELGSVSVLVNNMVEGVVVAGSSNSKAVVFVFTQCHHIYSYVERGFV